MMRATPMATSFYDLTVPTFLQTLRAMEGFLDRAARHCREIGTNPDDFVGARLIEDMAPFHFQIEAAWHHAVYGLEAAKTGVFAPPPLVGPVPFADLQSVIARAVTTLEALAREEVDSWAGRNLDLQIGPRRLAFTPEKLILSFSLPNFHFHVVTAYDILRSRGVPIGKRDYEGQLRVAASQADASALALALFQRTAREVPAYRAFLEEHCIDPARIATREDFERLPLLTKDGYLRKYPLAERCRRGDLLTSDTIAVSSGSTGEPTFWPRAVSDERLIAKRFEQIFADSFESAEKRTLAVICFPLGTWVGGMFTAACCRHLAAKGYPILTVTPGNVKAEILRVVRELAPNFDQTVLLGYPPFLKDVVDGGAAAGIRWSDYSVKLVLAGEVFTEEWRTLMTERAGMTRPLLDFASMYGTADAGVLGNETPVSIAIRRFLASRPDDARALFGEARLPTLVQYDPCSRYFEEHEGTLVFSGENGVPLVRYHISDRGGVIPFDAMMTRMREMGCDPIKLAKDAGAKVIRELPFVYVFGRSHFAISYFGANIFPEMVSGGLEQPDVAPHVTGKFVMQIVPDADQNLAFTIAVELAAGAKGDAVLEGRLADAILAQLLRLDPEFATYVPAERQRPRITLHAMGDAEYFPVGVKHRYSR